MRFFLGIDSGSTKTAASLSDDQGIVRAVARCGSLNLVVRPADEMRREFGLICDEIVAKCPEVAEAGVASTFVGSAGIVGGSDARTMRELLEGISPFSLGQVEVANDVQLVLAGGIPDGVGIALISGTGSNCFGRRQDGSYVHVGGQEWLVDDRGSGFRIGLQGIVAAVRSADEREKAAELQRGIFDALNIESSAEVISRLHGANGEHLISKTEVASLAPIVIELAVTGESVALRIVTSEMKELALMLATAAQRLGLDGTALSWTVAGSVGTHPFVLAQLQNAIAACEPLALYAPMILSPERAALLLAAQRATHHDLETFTQNLIKSP